MNTEAQCEHDFVGTGQRGAASGSGDSALVRFGEECIRCGAGRGGAVYLEGQRCGKSIHGLSRHVCYQPVSEYTKADKLEDALAVAWRGLSAPGAGSLRRFAPALYAAATALYERQATAREMEAVLA